jgi:bacterial/archaeal transporter family protein
MWVIVLITLTIILWGIAPLIDKIALAKVDPWAGVTIRSWAVCVYTIVFMLLSGRIKSVVTMDLRSIGLFSLSGLLAGFLAMATYYTALKLEPTSRIVALVCIYPLLTTLLAVIFLKEGVTTERVIGTILIVAGIWFVK